METDAGASSTVVVQAPRILRDLTPLLNVTSEDSLSLVAETLLAVVELGNSAWLTPDMAPPLVTTLMEVWVKNVKGAALLDHSVTTTKLYKLTHPGIIPPPDQILLSTLSDIFVALARCPVPGVYQAIVTHTLPSLAAAISHTTPDESWISSSAIDLATSLIRGVPKGQLGDGFFAVLGPALFGCLLTTEDREVIQVLFVDLLRNAHEKPFLIEPTGAFSRMASNALLWS